MFYPNLEAELARRKIRKVQLARKANIKQSTLSGKLNGKSPITLSECIEIRNAIDRSLSIDYLFVQCKDDTKNFEVINYEVK